MERVCIVRIPHLLAAKRSSAAFKGKDEDVKSQFVLNNLVGAPPEEILPVVPHECAETVREERVKNGLRPSEAIALMGAGMAAVEETTWGWQPRCIGSG